MAASLALIRDVIGGLVMTGPGNDKKSERKRWKRQRDEEAYR